MSPAKAKSTGLEVESDNLEMSFDDLPPWEKSRRKTFPVVSLPSLI